MGDQFQFGTFLFAFWMINPVPMILSVIGLFRDKTHRKFYLAMVILLPIMWLAGGAVIAPHF